MITNFVCPFCDMSVAVSGETYKIENSCFNLYSYRTNKSTGSKWNNAFRMHYMFCPNCKGVSIFAEGIHDLDGINVPLYPNSQAKRYPDFVPLAIRQDYEEAYAILNLSPKASATLSRRCLQGMIRDFWNVKAGKLSDEINEIQDKVASSQWKAIDALRSIGNIGAHMEKDVNEIIDIDDGEAEKLIKLIELLIEKWYIARRDEEELLKSIVEIKECKKSGGVDV